MILAKPEIAVERLDGLHPDGHEPLAAPLAQYADEPGVEVDVVRVGVGWCPAQVCHLGPAGAGVDEQAQDRRVAPACERPIRVHDVEQGPELGFAEDRRRLLGHLGRPHAGHRGHLDELLLDCPSEERLEPCVPVVRGRRRVALKEILDERLDVLASEARERVRALARDEEPG